jgi:hypothetical protein
MDATAKGTPARTEHDLDARAGIEAALGHPLTAVQLAQIERAKDHPDFRAGVDLNRAGFMEMRLIFTRDGKTINRAIVSGPHALAILQSAIGGTIVPTQDGARLDLRTQAAGREGQRPPS